MVETFAGSPCSADFPGLPDGVGGLVFGRGLGNQAARTHLVVGDGKLEYPVDDQPSAGQMGELYRALIGPGQPPLDQRGDLKSGQMNTPNSALWAGFGMEGAAGDRGE